jgi:peptidoglycan/xylan/chitin deacetylase (PgdA/CDA1 family)
MMDLWSKVKGRYQRDVADIFFQRRVNMRNSSPLISFSFDDFPRTAYSVGGSILKTHGVRGSYYASLGLMGQQTEVGPIFLAEDLKKVVSDGHELGCHTYDHCHSWETMPRVFERSIIRNQEALTKVLPGAVFKSLAYPISYPRPNTKRRAGRHFLCCRGGSVLQVNSKTADLNNLGTCFIDRPRSDLETIKRVIARNQSERGWLIFATHDVCEAPSAYGCTPKLFEQIVRYALLSGAQVLPVVEAAAAIRAEL